MQTRQTRILEQNPLLSLNLINQVNNLIIAISHFSEESLTEWDIAASFIYDILFSGYSGGSHASAINWKLRRNKRLTARRALPATADVGDGRKLVSGETKHSLSKSELRAIQLFLLLSSRRPLNRCYLSLFRVPSPLSLSCLR